MHTVLPYSSLSTRLAALSAVLLLLSTSLSPVSADRHRAGNNHPRLTRSIPAEVSHLYPNQQDGGHAIPIAAVQPKARVHPRTKSKHALAERVQSDLCPVDHEACATPSGGFECIDTQQELFACGGCPESGGTDCEQLPHVVDVSCASARCQVHTCEHGYWPNDSRTACVPSLGALRLSRQRRGDRHPHLLD